MFSFLGLLYLRINNLTTFAQRFVLSISYSIRSVYAKKINAHMRTFLEIYKDAEANGIVEVFDKVNTLKAQYLIMGWDTNSINYEFTKQQLLELSSYYTEISGFRAGSCSGCMLDVINRMNTWLINNKPLPEPIQAKQNESKRKRKA